MRILPQHLRHLIRPDAAQLRHRSWVDVTAELDVKRHEIYGGEGPWLRASQVTPTTPPQDELVYFLR